MATERDLELLDDYLGNRLGLEEKSAFEQKLASDPELKKELEFQQALVRSIRNERMAELKSMLNNIPVPSSGLSTAAKTLITLGAAAVVSLAVYFMLDTTPEQPKAITENVQTEESPAVTEEAPATEPSATGTSVDANESTSSGKEEKSEEGKSSASTDSAPKAEKRNEAGSAADTQAARQPELNVFDPSSELEEEESKPENVIIEQEETTEAIKRSSIAVETDNTDKKYNFHYQFRDSKLVLYGSFDKNLIEILEFFSGNKHTIFLYFNSNYYLLDENQQTKPALLKPITEPALLSKLKEYRDN